MTNRPRIAVLIPALNEAASIGEVVSGFRAALPAARICVYDNASVDETAECARRSGAELYRESQRGKGNVVRRMFADIEADIYVLVDGDGTYDPRDVTPMLERLTEDDLDMVVGNRMQEDNGSPFRAGHRFGNHLLSGAVAWLFGRGFDDMLSGYRVMSRRFVKSFPALSTGFETETELTVHALDLRVPAAEVPVRYGNRPEGSQSKLNTFGDGLRILFTILLLLKEFRPFLFFATCSGLMALLSLAFGLPVVAEYLSTGLVPRFPTAILASALMIIAGISLALAFILDSVGRGRKEFKRLAYLAQTRWAGTGAGMTGDA